MQNLWSSTVKQIIYANILQLVCGFLAGIMSVLSVARGFAGSSSSGASAFALIFSLGTIGGFIWYFVKVNQFVGMQADENDKASILNLRNAIIVSLVSAFLSFIPVAGWILALIGGLVAAIMMILAFSSYSASKSLPLIGTKGAGELKVYAIISLIGSILTIIPIVGAVLSLICSIIAIIFMFMGWSKIASACPVK